MGLKTEIANEISPLFLQASGRAQSIEDETCGMAIERRQP